MSGGMLRIKTADGTEYEVPEENGEQAMKLLDAKGVKFEASGQRPGQQPGFEPDPNIQPDAPEKPWYQALAEGGEDVVSGLTHGATMHTDSMLTGGIKARNEEAAQRSPYAFATADTVGSFLPTAIMGAAGLAGRAGSWLSNVGASGLQGMVQGGTRGFSDSNPDADMTERLQNAATQAEVTGAGSAAMTGVMDPVARLLGGTSGMLKSGATKARGKAYGLGPDEVGEYAEKNGLDSKAALAALVRAGDEMAPPNYLAPRSTGSIAEKFKGGANALDSDIRNSIYEAQGAGAQLPSNVRATAERGLDQAADDAMLAGRGDQEKLAAAIRGEANASGQGAQISDPFGVRDQKIELDKTAFKGAKGSPESYAGQAAKTHADQYRGMLDDYVGQGPPENYDAFRTASDKYGPAATLRDSATALATKQDAGGGWVPKLVGPAVGGAAGYAMGGVPGMGAGMAMGYAARNAPQNLYADFGANLASGGAGAAEVAGNVTNWIAQQAPTAAAVAVDLQTPKPTNGALQDQAQDHYTGSQSAADGGRGYLAPQRIKQALQSAPQVLGPYADQLSQAKDDSELEAMIEKLGRTDPRFANQILPRFQQ